MTSSSSSGLKPTACRTIISISLCVLSSFAIFIKSHAAVKLTTLEAIKKKKELVVCSESGYIPLEMKTASGKWLGFDYEMSLAYAKELGVKLTMADTKWDGIIPSLISSKCDMIVSSMAKTVEREKAVAFSDPYYNNNFLIAVLDTPENRKKFAKIENFNTKDIKIAVKTGSAPDLYLKNSETFKNAEIMRFDADSDTVSAVLRGRSTAFIYDTPYVRVAELNNPGKLYVFPETFDKGDQFAVAMRTKDTDLVSSFNTFLANWKKSGGYEKTMKYYFESREWLSLLDK
ncbi:transporter substrate-binding domain-containing protein [Fluviispira sanaruensis]|uniref:transporter substrate-binding domain-containing protein n=1 Tax=Fluviispira sanaruensis TaxID=2493639 RepID=UPI001559AA3C|nr:transporter substrate-binding domain-containing protein [Fluviispira sanaruensis]